MPLYEYECFLCGERFERIQKFSDQPLQECPFCQGAVRRLLGVPALQFKGSGFYITDYAKKEKPREPSESSESSTTTRTDTTASTSKPAAKVDSKGGSKAGD